MTFRKKHMERDQSHSGRSHDERPLRSRLTILRGTNAIQTEQMGWGQSHSDKVHHDRSHVRRASNI